MKTPFDKIIVDLTRYNFFNRIVPNDFILLILQHLQMLRKIYLRMIEVDFYEQSISREPGTRSITIEESALNSSPDSYSVYLDYIQFLFVLNQFGRALEKYNYLRRERDFPYFYRIRFFRNCVGEHWEKHVPVIRNNGFMFTHLKASIPLLGESIVDREKLAIEKSLINEFTNSGVKIRIPRKFVKYVGMSNNTKYCKYFYRKLEVISPELNTKYGTNKIPKKIVELLFKFDFPVPITDIEEYSKELIDFIYKIIKKKKIILPN